MLVKLEAHEDERGRLTVVPPMPFAFRRAFWVDGFREGISRGGHAHRTCEQLIVALCGKVAVSLERELSRGHSTRNTWLLDRPDRAVYVAPMTFVEYYGTRDAVCLVLASEPYDEADIIQQKGE